MAKTRGTHPPEFRHQMVELVRAGRAPEELVDEFEPTAQSIRNWLSQSERNAGRGDGGLTTAEREELSRLRCENRQRRLAREILSKVAAWFARVSPAARAESANRRTADGQPVHSFATLLTDLANLTCDTVRFDNALPVTILSKPTPVQQRVFHLLGLNLAAYAKR